MEDELREQNEERELERNLEYEQDEEIKSEHMQGFIE